MTDSLSFTSSSFNGTVLCVFVCVCLNHSEHIHQNSLYWTGISVTVEMYTCTSTGSKLTAKQFVQKNCHEHRCEQPI